MNKLWKVGVIVCALVSIVAIGFAINFFNEKEQLHALKLVVEKKLTETLDAKYQVETELSDTIAEKVALEAKAMELEAKVTDLKRRLEEERILKDTLVTQLDEKEKEIAELKDTIGQTTEEKETFMRRISQLEGQRDTLKTQLDKLRSAKKSLEERLKELMSSPDVDLKKIVVTSDNQNLRGTVLAVNSEFDFVVINLGQDHGIKTGKVLTIYRAGQRVGDIRVARTYEAMSIADILPGTVKIQEGDMVKSN
jgi:predicted nuclease with TOPRIM domain